MKKLIVIIVAATILIGFAACNRDGCGCYKPVMSVEKLVQIQLDRVTKITMIAKITKIAKRIMLSYFS